MKRHKLKRLNRTKARGNENTLEPGVAQSAYVAEGEEGDASKETLYSSRLFRLGGIRLYLGGALQLIQFAATTASNALNYCRKTCSLECSG